MKESNGRSRHRCATRGFKGVLSDLAQISVMLGYAMQIVLVVLRRGT